MKFRNHALQKNLHPSRITKVKTVSGKTEKRLLMEFRMNACVLNEDELIIQKEDSSYTEEYIRLTSDYYPSLPQKRQSG